MNLRRELDTAVALARRAGERIAALHGSGIAVDTKDDDSPVTEADREANAMIVAELAAQFPDDGILSEELPDDGSRLGGRACGWSIRSTAPRTSSAGATASR